MERAWFLIPIALAATIWLYFLVSIAPKLQDSMLEQTRLQFPSSLQEMKELSHLLEVYREDNLMYVVVLFSSAYLYKQAFSIPGSALLNVLAGALFGSYVAFPLCSALTAIGASCCYLMSHYLIGDLLLHYWPERVHKLQQMVARNSHNLLYYLLFLRLFPVTPNWLINLVAPLAAVPLPKFFVTVFIGLMPYNFLCVQAGEVLSTLTSLDALFSSATLTKLALMASVALLPTLIMPKQEGDEQTTHLHKR